jgi:uncharacterized membrane protein
MNRIRATKYPSKNQIHPYCRKSLSKKSSATAKEALPRWTRKLKTDGTPESRSTKQLEKWLTTLLGKAERSTIILCLSILIYGIIFSALTILRYDAYEARAWDLGIFTQSLWTTLNANKFLYHTCELFINPSGSFFGVHFSPILFFILPFYWVATRPETLLVIQSFILPLAAVPIYKLAKEQTESRVVGLTFAAAYLIYPATQFVNLYDFHVQSFLPLFFSFTIYYLTEENWPRYFLFILLSLSCEEHAAWATFAMGIYVAWKYRSQLVSTICGRKPQVKMLLISLLTMVMSTVWYWFTLWQRDTFFPTNPVALPEFLGASNFSILGAKNPLEIPLLIFLRPLNAIQALTYDGTTKLTYLLLLFGPLAFFSLRAPSALIPAIPWLGFGLLSQDQVHHMLGHHYETYVVSFIFAAATFGLAKYQTKTPNLKRISGFLKKTARLRYIAIASLVFFFTVGPMSPIAGYLFPNFITLSSGNHGRILGETINLVPSNASILTQDNLFPYVSHRVDAYVVPVIFLNSHIRSLTIDFVNQTIDRVEYILLDKKTDPTATELVLSILKVKPDFTLLASGDDNTILLYRRKP